MYQLEENKKTSVPAHNGAAVSDAELDALKADYRTKTTALDALIAQYEAQIRSLTGTAREATSQDILTAVQELEGGGGVDTEELVSQIADAFPTIPDNYATQTDISTLQSILNGIVTSMYKGVPVVTPQGSGTQNDPYVLQPNQWNRLGTAITGNVTVYFSKGTDIANITNCYMVRFTLDTNWTGAQVVFDGFNLRWHDDEPGWTAGNTYEVNIVDNIALWAEIEPAQVQ